jgi:hypothetical protein
LFSAIDIVFAQFRTSDAKTFLLQEANAQKTTTSSAAKEVSPIRTKGNVTAGTKNEDMSSPVKTAQGVAILKPKCSSALNVLDPGNVTSLRNRFICEWLFLI